MESQYQKWVNLSYLAAAVLVGYILFSGSSKLVSMYDLETRVKNVELILRGVAVVGGAGMFFGLYRHQTVNRFMNEVVLELSRVIWPTPKDTSWATVVVIIMVVLSGFLLGFLDRVWIQALQWILG